MSFSVIIRHARASSNSVVQFDIYACMQAGVVLIILLILKQYLILISSISQRQVSFIVMRRIWGLGSPIQRTVSQVSSYPLIIIVTIFFYNYCYHLTTIPFLLFSICPILYYGVIFFLYFCSTSPLGYSCGSIIFY